MVTGGRWVHDRTPRFHPAASHEQRSAGGSPDHICGMTDPNQTKSFSEASASAGEETAITRLELQRKPETDRQADRQKVGLIQAQAS